MSTQIIPQNVRQPGCPRRILTDRTYLKDQNSTLTKPASMRLRETGDIWSPVLLQKDTIIGGTRLQ
jgi:hypothetical protein